MSDTVETNTSTPSTHDEHGSSPAPPVKPLLRGVSHQVAFFVALVVGPILVVTAPSSARWAVGIYAVTLAGLFGVSALFHRHTWQPVARQRMRRLDHSMIFVFIAGTYTPVAGLTLPREQAIAVVTIVWIGALTGVACKLLWTDVPRWLSATSYVGLGWVAVLALPSLWRALGPGGFSLLLLGGVLYTIGAILYARRSPNPVPNVFGYHEVFHAFVIAAALCHLAVIVGWALPHAG